MPNNNCDSYNRTIPTVRFYSVKGTVVQFEPFFLPDTKKKSGCYYLYIEGEDGQPVNFIITPTTYIVGDPRFLPGNQVEIYYENEDKMALIYPPELRAIVIVKQPLASQVKLAVFDGTLTSTDGELYIKVDENTDIFMQNGDEFNDCLEGQVMLVFYKYTTRSIPAQTTADTIVVFTEDCY